MQHQPQELFLAVFQHLFELVAQAQVEEKLCLHGDSSSWELTVD